MQQAASNPDSVNLENVRKGERMVAMDLGLGVYDAPGAQGREGQMEGKGMGPVVDTDLSAQAAQSADDQDEDEDGSGSEESESESESSSGSEENESELPSQVSKP